MNTLEDRLRDAYRAYTDTIRPETVLPHGVQGLRGNTHPPARPARRIRSLSTLLIPLAAAVAVTAVVAGTEFGLAPHIFTGHGHGQPAAAANPTPAFFVALNWRIHPSMFAVNATTGTPGTRIHLPSSAGQLAGVATGDGRTFVAAAAQPRACQTALYRFRLAANGTPTPPAKFATVPGLISSPWEMAVTGSGRTVVYDALDCGQPSSSHVVRGFLAMVDTTTGQTKHWTFTDRQGNVPGSRNRNLPCGGDTSLSVSEHAIGFCDLVVLDDAPPGPVLQRGRLVARDGEFGRDTAIGGMDLAPDGKTVYFASFHFKHNKPVDTNWQLRRFDLATGQTRLVRNVPGTQGTEAAATPDPTGRYLLIEYTAPRTWATRLARLDIATGQVTQLNASWAIEAEIAW
ncbi:MAG TPA: hypothetical protein VGS19_37835 [Streptosporangiaceae bacterium]|nr:hypothetical protein [Streptosporangiaceae bacterium]